MFSVKFKEILYTLIVFLSAFLLFLVQPLYASFLLPLYGGSSIIWSTSVMVFQFLLLLGYIYSHMLVTLKRKYLWVLHLSFLALSAVMIIYSFFNVDLLYLTKEKIMSLSIINPFLSVITFLILGIGLQFFLLSTTSGTIQYIYYKKFNKEPYKLYAVSNIGSFCGLFLYLVLEYYWGLHVQITLWGLIYTTFSFLILLILSDGVSSLGKKEFDLSAGILPKQILTQIVDFVQKALQSNRQKSNNKSTGRSKTANIFSPKNILSNIKSYDRDLIKVLLISTLSSGLLLAATNDLTLRISPFPLLWIMPLALYLLSFVLSFNNKQSDRFKITAVVFVISTIFLAALYRIKPLLPYSIFMGLFLITSFYILHRYMYKIRPKAEKLTSFYLMMSLGGFIGGLIVGYLVPVLTKDLIEFLVFFILTVFAVYIGLNASINNSLHHWASKYAFFPLAYIGYLLYAMFYIGYFALPKDTKVIFSDRNFYGNIKVLDAWPNQYKYRSYLSGTIVHGSEYYNQEKRYEGYRYYPLDGMVYKAFKYPVSTLDNGDKSAYNSENITTPKTLGLIGLGAGTLAEFCNPGDNMTYFEINPMSEKVARDYFTYLGSSPCSPDVVIGDGRLELQKYAEDNGPKFDLFVLDAFSDDAIPRHLLTKEAFEIYLKNLKDDGILVFHITNIYLDLRPVLAGLAEYYNLPFYVYQSPISKPLLADDATDNATDNAVTNNGVPGTNIVENAEKQTFTTWVVMTRDSNFIQYLESSGITPFTDDTYPTQPILWTDDKSNILDLLI